MSDSNNSELRKRVVSKLLENDNLRKWPANDGLILADELMALFTKEVGEAEKRALLEGIRIGANEVGALVKDVVKDYDQIGNRIANNVIARLTPPTSETERTA